MRIGQGPNLQKPRNQLPWQLFVAYVLELLAFESKNVEGHATLDNLPFKEFLKVHARTVPGNMPVKFEDCSFNRYGDTSI